MTDFKEKLWRKAHQTILPSVAALHNALIGPSPKPNMEPTGFRELDEIKARSLVGTDISDHLISIFIESITHEPKLIVELGVRGGESTFVFERTAKLCRSILVSVDIDECSRASNFENWHFVKRDDVLFASEFASWCKAKSINPAIDLLFIDTSHLYDHTLSELQSWFPLLSANAKVILHDTNMKVAYRRKNGTIGIAWNNDRGVIRALEDYLGKQFDETADFMNWHKGWLIKHHQNSLGLTILQRFELPNTTLNRLNP